MHRLCHYIVWGNGDGPLFRYANGTRPTQTNFTAEFYKALQRIRMDPQNYSGNSFRAAAATVAANQGTLQ